MKANAEAAAVLEEAGQSAAARRVARCGADGLVAGCGRGHYRKMPVLCGHRLCGTCAPKRAGRLAHTYKPGVRAFAYPCLLTLTIRNLPALNREDLLSMKRAFARLRRRAVFVGHTCTRRCRTCPHAKWHPHNEAAQGYTGGHASGRRAWTSREASEGWFQCRGCKCSGPSSPYVTAGLCALEVTASERTGWHPHLHVIIDSPRFSNIFRIGAEWRDACAQEGLSVGDYAADIESIETWARKQKRKGNGARNGVAISRDAAVTYALKYACKSDVPDEMRPEYAAATARVRLVQPFGELIWCPERNPPKELKDDDPELIRKMDAWWERRRKCECPACQVREARKEKRKMLPMCVCCTEEWFSERRDTFTDEHAGALAARIASISDRDYSVAAKAVAELAKAGAFVCAWESHGLFSSVVRWVYERAHEVPDELLNQVDAWLRAEEGTHALAN